MSQQIYQKWTLKNKIDEIMERSGFAQKEIDYLNTLANPKIRFSYSLHIHYLYAILRAECHSNILHLIFEKCDLLHKFSEYLQKLERQSLSKTVAIEDYTLKQILVMVTMAFDVDSNKQNLRIDIEYTKKILSFTFGYISENKKSVILSLFLQVLYNIWMYDRKAVNQIELVRALADYTTQIPLFFQFFADIFGDQIIDFDVFQCFLKGFIDRLPAILSNQDLYESNLVHVFSDIAEFLWKEPRNSLWFNNLLSPEYRPIFDALFTLTTKNSMLKEIAYSFNLLIQAYLQSSLLYTFKFEFVLNCFKKILEKAPNFFALAKTPFLKTNSDFLDWFVDNQLKHEKADYFVGTYMNSQYGFEFLLTLLICHMNHFPQKISYVAGMMQVMNMLEQVKPFMNCEILRPFLQAYFNTTEEIEEWQNFESSILNAQVRMQL